MLFCSYLKVVFTNFGLTNSSRSSLFTRIPNKFFLGISLTVPHIFAFQSVIKAIQLSAPLSNQLQLPFIEMRNIYETRECPSRMYTVGSLSSWLNLCWIFGRTSVEHPWVVFVFFCWFWTVGFPSSRLYISAIRCASFAQVAASICFCAWACRTRVQFLFLVCLYDVSYRSFMQAQVTEDTAYRVGIPFRQFGWWQWM